MKSLILSAVVLMFANLSQAGQNVSIICSSTNKPAYFAIVKNLVHEDTKQNWCDFGTAQVDILLNGRLNATLPATFNGCSKHGVTISAESSERTFSLDGIASVRLDYPTANATLAAPADISNPTAEIIEFSCVILK